MLEWPEVDGAGGHHVRSALEATPRRRPITSLVWEEELGRLHNGKDGRAGADADGQCQNRGDSECTLAKQLTGDVSKLGQQHTGPHVQFLRRPLAAPLWQPRLARVKGRQGCVARAWPAA